MIELSSLKNKLGVMNIERKLIQTFYLYRDPAYLIVYNIIKPYKNYSGRPRTSVYNWFNKIISKLKIKIKHEFAIYQNF